MSDYPPPSILPSQPAPAITPPPAAPPPSGKSWPPFMGMLSILTVVFPILFVCIYCLIVFSFVSQPGFDVERATETELLNMGLGTIALVCGALIVSIVGMIIGLGALFGKTANKILGIIGLVLNGFIVLTMVCGFLYLIL